MTAEDIKRMQERVYAKSNYDADGNYVMPPSVRSGFAKMHNRMAAAYDRFGKKEDAAAARRLAKKMGAN